VRCPSSLARPLLIVPCLLALVGSAQADSSPPPFAPDSIWNLPLRADAPLSPNSSRYTQWLTDQVDAGTPWINSTVCNDPIYVAPAGTPTVQVTLVGSQDPALTQAWQAVPIPDGATPANCGDKNFAVEQAQPNGTVKEWEFWGATQLSNGTWTASWGGVTDDMRTDRGVASSIAWSNPSTGTTSQFWWNVTASSMSMTAGVITAADLESGEIDHALAFSAPNAAKGVWMWPAQRSDGTSTDADALPEGAHLRLNPAIDLAKIPMTPLVRMIAEAAQNYGIVLRDQTGSSTTTFYTQQLSNTDQELFSQGLDGESAGQALQAFPWQDLEVLAAPTCSNSAVACNLTNNVVIDPSTSTPDVGEPVVLDTTNSTLNYPRSAVNWDLGTGSFNTPGGASVSTTWMPTHPGAQIIGVQIVTTDGTTTTGWLTVYVDPAPGAGTQVTGTPPSQNSSSTRSNSSTAHTSTSASTAEPATLAHGPVTRIPTVSRVVGQSRLTVGDQELKSIESITDVAIGVKKATAALDCLAPRVHLDVQISAASLRHGTKAKLTRLVVSFGKARSANLNRLPAWLTFSLAGLTPGVHSITIRASYTEHRRSMISVNLGASSFRRSRVVTKVRTVAVNVCRRDVSTSN
jgi:hypothetical protein